MSYSAVIVATGSCFIFAGLLALIRQSLLEPVSSQYPKAPAWLRNCMFAFAALQIFVGLRTLSAGQDVEQSMFIMGIGLVLYNGAMLFNLLRQRYPEDVWERLNKINDRLFCKDNSVQRWISK